MRGTTADPVPPLPMGPDPMRFAFVQHGDFRTARDRIAGGGPERYFGQKSTLDAQLTTMRGHDALVISLDVDEVYDVVETHGTSRWSLVAMPKSNARMARAAREMLRATRVFARIISFRPTHLFLRTSVPFVAGAALAAARRCGARSAALLLAALPREERTLMRVVQDEFLRELQASNVDLVAAYGRPAVRSLEALGMPVGSVRSYALKGMRTPDSRAPKVAPRQPPVIAYFGTMITSKGAGDVVAAAGILAARGRAFRLHMYGHGDDLPEFQRRAAAIPGVAFKGQVSSEQCFNAMCEADVVVVPSRHEFLEGMPLTLTDALASRTPVVCSDHPVFMETFRDREGLMIFPAADPTSLADTIGVLLDDRDLYASLSAKSHLAYQRVGATDSSLEDLLLQLGQRWGQQGSPPAGDRRFRGNL